MTTISSTTNQISPADERVFHLSNLVGDWKGTWTKNNQPVEFKVVNIRGTTAQVEFTHNGHTERGLADVSNGIITFGDVSIGTRNGQKAALEFSTGTAKQSAILNKQASTANQSNLVGNWNGLSRTNGQSILFQVKSVNGGDAQVSYTAGGITRTGTGSVLKNNTIVFGTAQITSEDGKTGTAIVKIGHQTFSIPVSKPQPSSTSSQVNKLA